MMKERRSHMVVLMAEDDADDRLLVKDAWEESRLLNELRFVEDGEELLDYLNQRGKYAAPADTPRPGLILLDLNMPRKDGREALQAIKANPELRAIPILILTTSKAQEDILRAYDLGASSFITKPVTLDSLVNMMKTLGHYWFEIVQLPPGNGGGHG